ncbi:MAG: NUDIX domain-containing protein [Candidatus Cloacimonetes bacterium]|nr:NUDIX domain-containing protein [Candidatus Cloacimonadota bacterium]
MSITKESYKGINYCIRCGNKLEILLDKENKLRPRCKKCGWTFYKNPIPASACVILNQKNEIVIIKRKYEPNPGEWALPSGYVEIDQSPEECAIMEMKEETGLIGEIVTPLGYYPDFSPIYEKVITFGFLMRITGGELRAGDDAVEALYVALDDLPEIVFSSHNKFLDQVRKMLSHKDLVTD